MKATVTIIKAWVAEVGRYVEPDYPISFEVDDWGERSTHAIGQQEGMEAWREMHGEAPEDVYCKVTLHSTPSSRA